MRASEAYRWVAGTLYDRRSALSFAALNLGLALATYGLVIEPLVGLFDERSSLLEQRSQTLHRFRLALETTQLRVTSIGDIAQKRPELLEYADEGMMDASLQTLLKQQVKVMGVRLASTKALPMKTVNGIRYVSAHLEFSGPLRSIQTAIYRIETAIPYIYIESASMSSRPALFSSASESPDIQVQVDVACGIGGGP